MSLSLLFGFPRFSVLLSSLNRGGATVSVAILVISPAAAGAIFSVVSGMCLFQINYRDHEVRRGNVDVASIPSFSATSANCAPEQN